SFPGGARALRNLELPEGGPPARRRDTLQLMRDLTEAGRPRGADDSEFAARLSTYDLAFRMQTEVPELFDLSSETRETLALYGVGTAPTDDYGRRCLLARRLV